MIDVVIIGAGPYGLSIAAHLRACRIDFRIFGSPMNTWLRHMPKGMLLKSEGFASSLYEPDSSFTLAAYCKEEKEPYADLGLPVRLETFSSYGLEFQKRFVPELENRVVRGLERCSTGFRIELSDGEVIAARRVVSAVGLSYFDHIPAELCSLPQQLATHSSTHGSLAGFKGCEVVVVGAGASALDLAALLNQVGAAVQLVTRSSVIRFHDRGLSRRPILQRIRRPMTGIGPGWKSWFCVEAPLVFRRLPAAYRLRFVQSHLGPAPGWFVREQVVGKIPFHFGVSITRARVQGGRVQLDLTDQAGASRTLEADHVIAATGYRVDLRRVGFLSADILTGIRSVENTPILSPQFESSVPGLYFVGAAAASTFGPMLRFAFGAHFTSRRLSMHLRKSAAI